MKFCDERIQKHLLSGGKIKRKNDNTIICINNDKKLSCGRFFNSLYILTENALTTDDWEIVEPEYDWDRIIKDKVLCVFSYNQQERYYIVGYLEKIESNGKFKLLDGMSYNRCKPFNPAEFNIAKDLKEYEK